jgi:hypothetical protein
LESRYLSIPLADFFGKIGLIPKRGNVREATRYLILLSNAGGRSGNEGRNADTIDKLKMVLNIQF